MPIILLFLIIWLIPQSGVAQAVEGVMLRDDTVRATPSAQATTLGKVRKNARVQLLANRGGWTQVRLGATTGWVRLLYVRRGAPSGASLSDSLSSARDVVRRGPDPGRVTATAGLRGLDAGDLEKASFDEVQLARLESWSVAAPQARRFAEEGGLRTRALAYMPRPVSESSPGSGFDLIGGAP